MKKLIAILVVLCVAAAVFAEAGVTLKVGGAFDWFRVRTASDDDALSISDILKGTGLGVDLGAQCDISDSLLFFSDFNVVFFKDADFRLDQDGSEWTSMRNFYGRGDENEVYMNFWSTSFGFTYQFTSGSFDIALGGGLTYNRFWCNMKAEGILLQRLEIEKSYGFTGYFEAKYMMTKDMGLSLTVKPSVTLLGYHKTVIAGEEVDALSFTVGYAVPVALGLAYSF